MTLTSLLPLLAGGAAGAALARALRVPMWALIGSIAGAAVAHLLLDSPPSVPPAWTLVGQVLVGAAVGSTIARGVLVEFGRVLLPGLLAVVSIIAVGLALGVAIARLSGLDIGTTTLGMVPGGVGEMVAAATGLGVDSALVAGMHTARLLVVLTTLPVLLRWAERLRPDEPPHEP